MAAGIDIFFTGLMLICLDGQQDCPVGRSSQNTAWAVKADGTSKPCGWDSRERTELELEFSFGDFKYDPQSFCSSDGNTVRCILPEGDICLVLSSSIPKNQLESSLQRLPPLDDIDRRFKELRADRLTNPYYVPTRINFPPGVIGAGPNWPSDAEPTLWFRSDGSDGGALPSVLSDRLKVRYLGATTLQLTDCGASSVLKLTSNINDAKAVFRNRSKGGLTPYQVDEYDDLAYLLWYYRLGSWDTVYRTCPNYTQAKKDAVLLRCVRNGQDSCAFSTLPASDTKFWPPILRPGS